MLPTAAGSESQRVLIAVNGESKAIIERVSEQISNT